MRAKSVTSFIVFYIFFRAAINTRSFIGDDRFFTLLKCHYGMPILCYLEMSVIGKRDRISLSISPRL